MYITCLNCFRLLKYVIIYVYYCLCIGIGKLYALKARYERLLVDLESLSWCLSFWKVEVSICYVHFEHGLEVIVWEIEELWWYCIIENSMSLMIVFECMPFIIEGLFS